MAEHRSLADRAVAALSAVAEIQRSVTVESPERHIIWDLHRLAEEILSSAFDQASRISHLARTVHDTFKDMERRHD